MRLIFSIYIWVFYLLMYVLMIVPTVLAFIISFPFDKHRIIANKLFMFTGRSFIWFNPKWNIELRGLQNYKPKEPRIFVGNHQSFLDMPLLASLPWQMKWVSKDGLAKIPVLGQIMLMSGHLAVKRGTTQAMLSMKKLHPYLDAGIPVMLFPEGTRSRNGDLLKFKGGAFLMSTETNVPVQPILISGTRDIVRPDTFITRSSGTMIASILPPMYPTDYPSVGAFRDAVYQTMKAELESLSKLSDAK
jgi:1-acyl-sn-glycerol-3-phosphate acyltransferase